jgi:hypothetical protein
VTTWPNQDEAFVSITQGIRTAVQLMRAISAGAGRSRSGLVRSQYRQQVEEALADGVISPVERDTLEELREEPGFSADRGGGGDRSGGA